MNLKVIFLNTCISGLLILSFTACDKTYQHPCMTSSSGGVGLDDGDYKCCQNLQCEWITYQCKDVFLKAYEKCLLAAGVVATVTTGIDLGTSATACLGVAEIAELDCEGKKKDKYSADFGPCKVFEDGDIAAEKTDLTEKELETCPLDTADVPDPYTEPASDVGGGSYGASDSAIGAAQSLLDGTSAVSTESPAPSAAQFANVPSVAAAIASDKKPSMSTKTGNDGSTNLSLPTAGTGSGLSGSTAGGSSGGLSSMGLTPQAAIQAAAVDESKQLSEAGTGYGSGGAGAMNAAGYSSGGSGAVIPGGGSSVSDLSRGPASGIETIVIEDPADYFTRTDLTDSIFKIVERRYRSESMKWMKQKSGL